ncbi:MAG: eukaryotic-like serine/threonine-protein kinase [Acidobacteriota bacterium]|nr:eukaryotic-like serine/threonine-protein kinase [Acidobacteriota bacterium]
MTHNDFGTLDYCSPERLDTGRLDAQSDLWSLGVMLYEMLSGSLPFQAETPRAQEALIMSGQPPPPLPADCPKPLAGLIMKALDPDVSRRYQSAAEMLEELSGLDQPPTRRIRREEEDLDARPEDEAAGGEEGEAISSASGADEHQQQAEGGHKDATDVSSRAGEGGGWAGSASDRGGQKLRVGSLLFKAAVTIVVSIAVVLGAAEWLAWRAKRELYEDLSKATFLRLTDSEGFWNRYKGAEDKGVLKLGLPELRAQMKLKLLDVAQRVVKDYEKDRPTAKESDWIDAKASLARALEIESSDASVKAMMLYCDGQIERINGDAQKSRKKLQDASNRFNNAMRLFGDAAELQPQWPDPHLGLAVIYAYGSPNADRAVEELDKAKGLGLNLGNREVALRADCLRLKADAQYEELQRTPGARTDDYKSAKQQYAQALEKYRQVLSFTDNSRRYVREIEGKMQKLDAAIERREQRSGDGTAEVNQL